MTLLVRLKIFCNQIYSQKGFTLIELLIVVAIIGIIATVVIISVGNHYSRARDAIRKHDLSQLKTPLEIYFLKNGRFPDPGTGIGCATNYCNSENANWIVNLTPYYMNPLPKDPRQSLNINSYPLVFGQLKNYLIPNVYAVTPVGSPTWRYYYESDTNRTWYKLWVTLEAEVDNTVLTACGTPPVTGLNYCVKSN